MVICFCQAEKQKCMKQLYLYLINLQSPVHCGSCTFETLVQGVWYKCLQFKLIWLFLAFMFMLNLAFIGVVQ